MYRFVPRSNIIGGRHVIVRTAYLSAAGPELESFTDNAVVARVVVTLTCAVCFGQFLSHVSVPTVGEGALSSSCLSTQNNTQL